MFSNLPNATQLENGLTPLACFSCIRDGFPRTRVREQGGTRSYPGLWGAQLDLCLHRGALAAGKRDTIPVEGTVHCLTRAVSLSALTVH